MRQTGDLGSVVTFQVLVSHSNFVQVPKVYEDCTRIVPMDVVF